MDHTTRLAQLEAQLADDPTDPFLRYGVALEHESGGDSKTAADKLASLIADSPDYVPAYLMGGQILAKLGREMEACDVLRLGVTQAKSAGNEHAAGEMAALLATLE